MQTRKLVAIHQPNFLPWLGFFDKVARSDLFLLMDNVQFPRGTVANRVKVLVAGRAHWATVPLRGAGALPLIRDVEIDDRQPWRDRLLKTLRASYARAPRFRETFDPLADVVMFPTTSLADFNINAIETIVRWLGLPENRLVRGSTLPSTGQATDLLLSMVSAVGGTGYLFGRGAAGYQENHKFTDAGLELVPQEFTPPPYAQHGATEFVPGLSIVDALMNVGASATAALLGQPSAADA